MQLIQSTHLGLAAMCQASAGSLIGGVRRYDPIVSLNWGTISANSKLPNLAYLKGTSNCTEVLNICKHLCEKLWYVWICALNILYAKLIYSLSYSVFIEYGLVFCGYDIILYAKWRLANVWSVAGLKFGLHLASVMVDMNTFTMFR